MKKFLFFLIIVFVVLGAVVLSVLLENEKTENISTAQTTAYIQETVSIEN